MDLGHRAERDREQDDDGLQDLHELLRHVEELAGGVLQIDADRPRGELRAHGQPGLARADDEGPRAAPVTFVLSKGPLITIRYDELRAFSLFSEPWQASPPRDRLAPGKDPAESA